MEDPENPLIKIVRAGLERACGDFTRAIAPLGFTRTKKMVWGRPRGDLFDQIGFFRLGSSYGPPRTASVDIRVSFSIEDPLGSPALRVVGPSTDQLRDHRGYAYHLRFNASSWSTYDRCISDLIRVTNDHAIPWFTQSGPDNSVKSKPLRGSA